jgi:hypothetical protein
MFTKFFLSIITALAFGIVSVGNTTATAAVAIPPVSFPIIDGAFAAPSTVTLAAASQLTDGTYRGNVNGTLVTLVIKSGAPTQYSYGTWKTNKVRMLKNFTVKIDQGRLKITGLSSEEIVGVFSLNGRKTNMHLKR